MTKIDPADAKRNALEALLPQFLNNRKADAGKIREAITKNDFETIARIGHNLRGNGASYGFPELSKLGEAMEVAANLRQHDALTQYATRLDALVVEISSRH